MISEGLLQQPLCNFTFSFSKNQRKNLSQSTMVAIHLSTLEALFQMRWAKKLNFSCCYKETLSPDQQFFWVAQLYSTKVILRKRKAKIWFNEIKKSEFTYVIYDLNLLIGCIARNEVTQWKIWYLCPMLIVTTSSIEEVYYAWPSSYFTWNLTFTYVVAQGFLVSTRRGSNLRYYYTSIASPRGSSMGLPVQGGEVFDLHY